MRTPLYLFFIFFITSAFANNIVPPVIVKAPSHTITSGPKNIITQQQISSSGITTFTQALQDIAGIQLQNITGNNSQVTINMRGFGANATSNTLLLLNGIPLTNPDLAPPDLNAIPLADIEYLEIIAGSESVLYGDQAVGGIVNVITRAPTKKMLNFACNAGSFDLRECHATFSHFYQRLQFNITAGTQYTDNYREHNAYYQNLLTGNFSFPYATGNLHFYYKIANEKMQYPGALTHTEVSENRRQANNDTDFFNDWSGLFHIKHQQNLSPNWQMETDFARRNMDGHGVLFSPFTQSRRIYFLKPQIKGTIYKALIVTGLDFQTDNYHLNSPFGPNDDSQQKYSLFGLANYPINTKFLLSLGARGAELTSKLVSTNQLELLNRAFTTTAGVAYQYTPALQFYARRAGSFRFPKADENAATPAGIVGLRTQRGMAYESGVQIDKENYSGKINLYQLNLRDEIAFDPTQTAQNPFGSNQNLSPTKRDGFSISGKDRFNNKLAMNAQYNYVNARFQNGIYANNRIPLVSENIIRAGIQYYFTDDFSIYPEAVFTGNQYAANDYANVAGTVGGYTVYNFNLHYERKHFQTSLRFNNVFNQYYYFYTVYEPSIQDEFFYPAPGRNVTLSLAYTFE